MAPSTPLLLLAVLLLLCSCSPASAIHPREAVTIHPMGSFNNHGATGTVLTLDEDRESLMSTLLSKRDASAQWDYYNPQEENTSVDSGSVAGLYGSRVHVPSASQEEEETVNQEEEDRKQEEENMAYFREFKNFFGEAKGAKFDTDFPVPRVTTPVPVPCLTMAPEDGW